VLDAATRAMELDHFVLFSSVAGIFGAPGQANYAAACAAMDAFAIGRQMAGRPTLSIAWGPWQYDGSPSAAHMRDSHFQAITPAVGLAWLGRLLSNADDLPARLVASRLDIRRVGWTNAASSKEAFGAPSARVDERHQAGELDRTAILHEIVTRVGRRLGQRGHEVAQDRSLASLGLDSLAVLELRNELSEDLGVTLAPRRLINAAGLAEIAEQAFRQHHEEMERAAIRNRLSDRPDSTIDTLSDAEVEQALNALNPQMAAK
jgi:acyl carrier protein